jgi:peptidoglycan/LPS O-acetylase OafA/YrhL
MTLGLLVANVFVFMHLEDFGEVVFSLAKNEGKHPPNLDFMLYANGGALIIFGLMLLVRGPWLIVVKPFSIIGRESLLCFNFHIIFIFVVYRYYGNLRHNVTYSQALFLTLIVFVLAIAAAQLNTWRKDRKKQGRRRPQSAPPDPAHDPTARRAGLFLRCPVGGHSPFVLARTPRPTHRGAHPRPVGRAGLVRARSAYRWSL